MTVETLNARTANPETLLPDATMPKAAEQAGICAPAEAVPADSADERLEALVADVDSAFPEGAEDALAGRPRDLKRLMSGDTRVQGKASS